MTDALPPNGSNWISRVVTSLSGTPGFLVLVIFNIALIWGAADYMARIEQQRGAQVERVLQMLQNCIAGKVQP